MDGSLVIFGNRIAKQIVCAGNRRIGLGLSAGSGESFHRLVDLDWYFRFHMSVWLLVFPLRPCQLPHCDNVGTSLFRA